MQKDNGLGFRNTVQGFGGSGQVLVIGLWKVLPTFHATQTRRC